MTQQQTKRGSLWRLPRSEPVRANHTPGPWEAAESAGPGNPVEVFAEFDGRYAVVARAYGWDGNGADMKRHDALRSARTFVAHANARLIASAPQMLELIRQLVDNDGGYYDDGPVTDARSLISHLDNGTPPTPQASCNHPGHRQVPAMLEALRELTRSMSVYISSGNNTYDGRALAKARAVLATIE